MLIFNQESTMRGGHATSGVCPRTSSSGNQCLSRSVTPYAATVRLVPSRPQAAIRRTAVRRGACSSLACPALSNSHVGCR
jgi:hypothetical protein